MLHLEHPWNIHLVGAMATDHVCHVCHVCHSWDATGVMTPPTSAPASAPGSQFMAWQMPGSWHLASNPEKSAMTVESHGKFQWFLDASQTKRSKSWKSTCRISSSLGEDHCLAVKLWSTCSTYTSTFEKVIAESEKPWDFLSVFRSKGRQVGRLFVWRLLGPKPLKGLLSWENFGSPKSLTMHGFDLTSCDSNFIYNHNSHCRQQKDPQKA